MTGSRGPLQWIVRGCYVSGAHAQQQRPVHVRLQHEAAVLVHAALVLLLLVGVPPEATEATRCISAHRGLACKSHLRLRRHGGQLGRPASSHTCSDVVSHACR